MKGLKALLMLMMVLVALTGCVAKYSIPEGSTNDMSFVGKWKGEHFNEEGEYWRKWTQTRNQDGTYKLVLDYYNKDNQFLETQIETGNWWVKDGVFYEINPRRMKTPEAYKFEFLGEEKLKFISVSLDSSSDEKESYSFTDTKVE